MLAKIISIYLLEAIEYPELPHMLVRGDEQVHARVLHLLRKHRDLYSDIFPLMGGFIQLRAFQIILFRLSQLFF